MFASGRRSSAPRFCSVPCLCGAPRQADGKLPRDTRPPIVLWPHGARMAHLAARSFFFSASGMAFSSSELDSSSLAAPPLVVRSVPASAWTHTPILSVLMVHATGHRQFDELALCYRANPAREQLALTAVDGAAAGASAGAASGSVMSTTGSSAVSAVPFGAAAPFGCSARRAVSRRSTSTGFRPDVSSPRSARASLSSCAAEYGHPGRSCLPICRWASGTAGRGPATE